MPAQLEGGALGVFGKLVAPGQRQMVVELLAEILDQRIVQYVQKIIRGRTAVMLLRVEPPGSDVGVPREHQLAAWNDASGRAGAAHERHCGCRQRCNPQYRASRYRRLLHSSCIDMTDRINR